MPFILKDYAHDDMTQTKCVDHRSGEGVYIIQALPFNLSCQYTHIEDKMFLTGKLGLDHDKL